jgi:hypothetical protein
MDPARLRLPRDSPLRRRLRAKPKQWVSVFAALGVVVASVVAAIWAVLSSHLVPGTPQLIGPTHDDTFPTVHAVSGTPADWVAAVWTTHKPQGEKGGAQFPINGVFLYPNTTFDLVHADYSGVCPARYRASSDSVVLIAQYPSEDLMQNDLARNKIEWYCFAATQGKLFVLATRAEEQEMGTNGLGGSPVLNPLVSNGFIVYGAPRR